MVDENEEKKKDEVADCCPTFSKTLDFINNPSNQTCCGPTQTSCGCGCTPTEHVHEKVEDLTSCGCGCTPTGHTHGKIDEKHVKDHIKQHYTNMVKTGSSCCGPTVKIDEANKRQYAEMIGYTKEELDGLEDSITGISFGCGNPTAIANLKPGEVVLDLGSGGGIDVFLSAKKVGDSGKAIGLDMTDEMLSRARENAKKMGLNNVEFKKGEMEAMPVENNTIDVVISNCVINLSPDKDKVFQEIYRVLKPKGRLCVSDIVLAAELPDNLKVDLDSWASCVSGALLEEDYIQRIKNVGFSNVKIESRRTAEELAPKGSKNWAKNIVSVKVTADKV